MSNAREEIIENYINAYNSSDVERMVENLALTIRFTNTANDEVTLAIEGLEAFKGQAMQAIGLFSQRKQTIKSMKHTGNATEIVVDYRATLAKDLPNGLKKGDELCLSGRSIFIFNERNQVEELKDIS